MLCIVVPGGLDLKPSSCSTLSNKPYARKNWAAVTGKVGGKHSLAITRDHKKLFQFVLHHLTSRRHAVWARTPYCHSTNLEGLRSWKFLESFDVPCTVLNAVDHHGPSWTCRPKQGSGDVAWGHYHSYLQMFKRTEEFWISQVVICFNDHLHGQNMHKLVPQYFAKVWL